MSFLERWNSVRYANLRISLVSAFSRDCRARCALYKADWFEVLGEKLPSLAFSAVKRMLLDSGAIFETAIHYIQHSPAA